MALWLTLCYKVHCGMKLWPISPLPVEAFEMETSNPNPSQNSREAATASWRPRFVEAASFWELRRIVYNLILTAVAFIWIVASWPHFRPAMTLESLGILTVLVLLANACYCAAYVAEISFLSLPSGASRNRGRWGIWVLGTLLAILFENYWIADEIYPYVR